MSFRPKSTVMCAVCWVLLLCAAGPAFAQGSGGGASQYQYGDELPEWAKDNPLCIQYGCGAGSDVVSDATDDASNASGDLEESLPAARDASAANDEHQYDSGQYEPGDRDSGGPSIESGSDAIRDSAEDASEAPRELPQDIPPQSGGSGDEADGGARVEETPNPQGSSDSAGEPARDPAPASGAEAGVDAGEEAREEEAPDRREASEPESGEETEATVEASGSPSQEARSSEGGPSGEVGPSGGGGDDVSGTSVAQTWPLAALAALAVAASVLAFRVVRYR